MMKLVDLNVKDFLAKVAGKDPVPGGGSISALNGALATALAEMVANLTIGRKKYAEVEGAMKNFAYEMALIQKDMIEYIDKDSDAYNRVFSAFKLPKETEEEKTIRRAAIQKETIYAAEVPMEVARATHRILPIISSIALKGNSNAVTDACVAMMCARNAVLGALLNVKINLSSIKDEKIVEAMSKEAEELEKDTRRQEEELLNSIQL